MLKGIIIIIICTCRGAARVRTLIVSTLNTKSMLAPSYLDSIEFWRPWRKVATS
jgi:hypothetical protein